MGIKVNDHDLLHCRHVVKEKGDGDGDVSVGTEAPAPTG